MVAAVAACVNDKPHVHTVHIDITQSRQLVPDTANIIWFEASDSALIYGVDGLIKAGETYVVHSRTLLRSFDARTGRYKGDIARYNDGESGFSNISHLWHRGDTLFLFDSNTRTLAKYLPDGIFLGKTTPIRTSEVDKTRPPRQIFKMNDGRIMVLNGSTGGSTKSNPLISIYDSDGRFITSPPGRDVKESAYLLDGAYYDHVADHLLIWEPLRDTVFVANSKGIYPLYAFDFGANSMVSAARHLPYLSLRAQAFSAGGREAPYASMLRYLQTDGDTGDIFFCFADSDKRDYIARYNERDGSLTVRHISTPNGHIAQTTFFLLDGDSLRIEMHNLRDVEANPGILTIAKSELQ